LVPFLLFFRALQALRVWRTARLARFGGVLSAGVRGSRSAGRLLSSRIGWLTAVTAVVILVSSQLLFISGSYSSYIEALHDAAMSTITGTELGARDGLARLLQVLLAIYSVAVFATLAGSIGAYFLRREPDKDNAKNQVRAGGTSDHSGNQADGVGG
jgi:voltage-gated potassium channel